MGATIYLRVSTDEQAESGAGLQGQFDACQAWCASNSVVVDRVCQDEIGGAVGLEKRPGLLEAIASLERGDVLLVAKRDRLYRGDPLGMIVIETAVWRRAARIISAAGEGTEGDSASDILLRRVADAVAEHERLVIQARTKGALQARKKRRQKYCRRVFGYRPDNDGNLRPVAEEQAVIDSMRAMREQGLSLRKITGVLNSQGIAPPNGRSRSGEGVSGEGWCHQSVSSVLKSAGNWDT